MKMKYYTFSRYGLWPALRGNCLPVSLMAEPAPTSLMMDWVRDPTSCWALLISTVSSLAQRNVFQVNHFFINTW